MANIKVLGKSLVIKSAMKKEDLDTIKKYRPDALNLYEGEGDKKDIKFSVLLAKSGNGSVDKYGVAYAPDTTDADGLAEATIVLGNVGDDLKEFIADTYGAAFKYLNALEDTLPDVIADILADKAAIMDSITIA